MPQRYFARYAWAVLAYNLLVILWGAFVRATGAGAGCGNHWPLCNGQVLPRAPQVETMIEFAHRLSSGLDGLLVLGLLVWALRAFPRGHMARRGAWLSLAFVIIEGLLGAALVKFELVVDNSSLARVVAMGVHLINTMLLIGAIALTAWWASGGGPLRLRGQGLVGRLLAIGIGAMLMLGATGAVTALGDTLFPAGSLRAGLAQDLDPTAHLLVRLRVIHPLFAILTGVYLLFSAQLIAARRPGRATQLVAAWLLLLFFAQLGLGALNLALLAPVTLQLAHLLLADLVWLGLVLLAASALDERHWLASQQQAKLTAVAG
jgi:heme A synthase